MLYDHESNQFTLCQRDENFRGKGNCLKNTVFSKGRVLFKSQSNQSESCMKFIDFRAMQEILEKLAEKEKKIK